MFAALFEIGLGDHFEGASKLEVDAAHRSIISRITKISRDVEGLLHAKPVVLQKAPAFLDFRDNPAQANRYHLLFEIKLVSVISKELEKKLSQGIFVPLTVSAVEIDVLVESNIDAIHDPSLQVGLLLQTRQDWWTASL